MCQDKDAVVNVVVEHVEQQETSPGPARYSLNTCLCLCVCVRLSGHNKASHTTPRADHHIKAWTCRLPTSLITAITSVGGHLGPFPMLLGDATSCEVTTRIK